MSAWIEKKRRVKGDISVSTMINRDVLERRRYYVRNVAEVIQFLAQNELSFRGDYDAELHKEAGLFNNLFQYTLTKNEQLAAIEKEIPRNCTYTSPEIQNDVIAIMADMITESVGDDVRSADVPFFSLMVDGSRNKYNVENLAIALRYVKGGKAYESLLQMPHTEKLDAASMTTVILDTLRNASLDTSHIISQCYDGASCMSGDKGGVQRLIQERTGRLIPYVHCFNHRLHLVVVDFVSTIPAIGQFFEKVGALYNFFRKPKVNQLYGGTSLKRVLDTRWTGHLDAVNAVVNNFEVVQETIAKVAQSDEFDGDTVATAIGLQTIVRRPTFVYTAIAMQKILGMLRPADKCLQSRETDLQLANILLETVQDSIKAMRNEIGHDDIWNTVTSMVTVDEEVVVEPVRHQRRRIASSRLADSIVMMTTGSNDDDRAVDTKSRLKILLFEVIDTVNSEIQRRFAENKWLNKALRGIVFQSDVFLSIETLQPLSKLGVTIPTPEELIVAKSYLKRLLPETDSAIGTNRLLEVMHAQKEAFPDTYAMLAAIATVASSQAVCESSFSSMTRIDRPQRRAMTTARQANLVLLSFEKKRTASLDMVKFVRKFAAGHSRLQLF